jgi:aconitate hydratase
VRCVVTESFERIHRSNLVGMGVLPLQFQPGEGRESLGLTGDESVSIANVAGLKPRQMVDVNVTRADGSTFTFQALCRIDTVNELDYFLNGGILPYVLRKLAACGWRPETNLRGQAAPPPAPFLMGVAECIF